MATLKRSMCVCALAVVWCASVLPSTVLAQAAQAGQSPGDRCRSEQRDRAGRDRDRRRPRDGDAGGDAGAGQNERQGHCDRGRPGAGALQHPRRVPRLRSRPAARRAPARRRQQARRRAAADEARGQRHRRPRHAGGRGRSAHVRVRPGADQGADRGAVRRSGGDAAADRRAGRPRRDHARGQLRGAAAAAEGADQVDPRRPRSVRGRSGAAGQHVRGDRDAARHGPAARLVQLRVPRRLDDRPQPLHGPPRPGAVPELRRLPRRLARAGQDQLQHVAGWAGQLHLADPLRGAARRHPRRDARHPPADARPRHLRRRRSRADTGPDAAHRLQPFREHAREPRHRQLRSPRACLHQRGLVQHAAPAADRAARPAVVHQHAPGLLVEQPAELFERQRADDHGAGRVQQRRRAADVELRSDPADVRLRRRLRARHPLVARRVPDRRPVAQLDQQLERARHLHVQQRGRVRRRSAAAVHAGARRPAGFVHEPAGGRLLPGRHPRAQGADAQPRRALQRAEAGRRPRRVRAALRPHLGADRRAARRRCAAAPGSSTASCRRSRSSRRCGRTASASAK